VRHGLLWFMTCHLRTEAQTVVRVSARANDEIQGPIAQITALVTHGIRQRHSTDPGTHAC
jgi:hypothetical protein